MVFGGSNYNVGFGFVSSCVGLNLGHRILGTQDVGKILFEDFCTFASRSGVALFVVGLNTCTGSRSLDFGYPRCE